MTCQPAPSPSRSGHIHITAHSPGGISYCDGYGVRWSGDDYGDQVYWDQRGISSTSYGMGISGKTKGFKGGKNGRSVDISDNYKGDINAGFMVSWQFGLPFKSGNAFNAYYTSNGTTVNEYIGGGFYTIGFAPAHHSGISTIDALPRRVLR